MRSKHKNHFQTNSSVDAFVAWQWPGYYSRPTGLLELRSFNLLRGHNRVINCLAHEQRISIESRRSGINRFAIYWFWKFRHRKSTKQTFATIQYWDGWQPPPDPSCLLIHVLNVGNRNFTSRCYFLSMIYGKENKCRSRPYCVDVNFSAKIHHDTMRVYEGSKISARIAVCLM